jgi:hypothetical protein
LATIFSPILTTHYIKQSSVISTVIAHVGDHLLQPTADLIKEVISVGDIRFLEDNDYNA